MATNGDNNNVIASNEVNYLLLFDLKKGLLINTIYLFLQLRTVEKILLKFCCLQSNKSTNEEATILLEIQGVSSWVLKFRKFGLITNNW